MCVDQGSTHIAFKYHIRYVFKIEQKIAREKGKLNVHFDKWEPINDLVSNVKLISHVKMFRPHLVGDGLMRWVVREPTRILW